MRMVFLHTFDCLLYFLMKSGELRMAMPCVMMLNKPSDANLGTCFALLSRAAS